MKSGRSIPVVRLLWEQVDRVRFSAARSNMKPITLITPPLPEYELLDSGNGEKLERYGSKVLARPDPQALWEKKLSVEVWERADGRYVRKGKIGEWKTRIDLPKEWQITFGGLQFIIRPTSFKHTGLFPEQLSNWEWSSRCIKKANRSISVLNLFGYTGGATLAAVKAGAHVVHVDASKKAVQWARGNASLSGVKEDSVHWMVEDALLFVQREIKRGHTYDAIIMDPPAFGHGPKDELWKIEEDLLTLVSLCKKLLSKTPLFFLINGYAAGYSPLTFAYNLTFLVETLGGSLEYGDLVIEEKGSGRLLPCGIFARWEAS